MTPASPGLDRETPLLKQRIRAVFRRLPKALAGQEEELHQMRVAGRRLRVALPLLARKPDGKRVRRALGILRQLTRTAGVSRDFDVAVTLFEERVRQMSPRTPERAILMRRLRAARARSRTRMAERLLDLEIAQLRRDLRVVVGRRAEGLFTVLRRLRETRDAQAAEVMAILTAVGDRFDSAVLHKLRIRLRKMRYGAEVTEVLKGRGEAAADELKVLQEQLGHVRDAYVLAHWFAQQAAAARARGQVSLAREARAQRAWFLEMSRGHHRTFLSQAPREAVRRAVAILSGTTPLRGRPQGPAAGAGAH